MPTCPDGFLSVCARRTHSSSGRLLKFSCALDPLSASGKVNTSKLVLLRGSDPSSPVVYVGLRSPSSQVKPDKHWEQPRSATGGSIAWSWPPPTRGGSVSQAYKTKRRGSENDNILHGSDPKDSFRISLNRSTSSISLPENPTDPLRKKRDNPSRPLRTRAAPLSSNLPDYHIWQGAQSMPLEETLVVEDSVRLAVRSSTENLMRSSPIPPPPGLTHRRSDAMRQSPDATVFARGSASLSLAPGSQPLRASERAKPVTPIGAERSRVMRILSSRSAADEERSVPRKSPPAATYPDRSFAAVSGSPAELHRSPSISLEEYHRLLRQMSNNKFTSKVASPLGPFRDPTVPFALTIDPIYRARMPSLTNIPSLRYAKTTQKRLRRCAF